MVDTQVNRKTSSKNWPKVKTGKYPGYLPLGIYPKIFTF